MEHEQRSSRRYRVNWQAWCRDEAGLTTRVTIVDCSDGNFGISGPCPPKDATIVQLSIDDIGEFSCRIIWARDNRFAVRIVDHHSESTISMLNADLSSGLV
jgi:hypothetical protein